MPVPYATVAYNGTGAQVAFAIPFNLIAANELHAKVGGVEVFTFTVSADKLTCTFTVAPPSGTGNVVLYRVTDIDDNDRPVDFAPGSTVTADQLDTAIKHVLHAAQEAADQADGSLTIPAGEFEWDAQGNRIKNVGAPVAVSDAVRKQDLDAAVIGAGQLPAVSGADNDSGLFVSVGAWAKRTAAQVRAHLALGTAALLNSGVANGQVPVMNATGYPAADGSLITNLPTPKPPLLLLVLNGSAVNNVTSGTWLTDSGGGLYRADIVAGSQEFNDTGNNMTFSAANDTFTLEAGTYLIQVHIVFSNSHATSPSAVIDWALTNDTGSSVYIDGNALPSISPNAIDANIIATHGAVILTLGSSTVLAIRRRNAQSTGTVAIVGNNPASGAAHSYALVERIS